MKKVLEILKNVFSKYPLTFTASILASLVYVVFYKNFENVFDICNSFLVPFGITSFLIETIFDKKKQKIYYLIPFVIGLIFCIVTRFECVQDSDLLGRILLFYYISVPVMGIYLCYKKTKKSFSNYMINLFSNFLELAIVYFVLNIGLILLLLLFDYLIIDGAFDVAADDILVLLAGCFLAPASIYAVYSYNEVNKFVDVLVTKVLFILVLVAYVVVYVYIVKILITFTFPSNMIFGILLALFIISTLVNIMGMDSEENKTLLKIHRILPYLFIPLIILQCYVLGLRVFNNGLTIIRYFGIMAIIFEIIYVTLYIRKKDEALLLPVIVIELLITFIIPFINSYDLSINNQYKALMKYKDTGVVTDRIAGAYDYLITYDKGKALIDKKFTSDEKKTIKEYTRTESENKSYYYSFYPLGLMDIEGYKTLEIVNMGKGNDIIYPMIFENLKSCAYGEKEKCFEDNNIFIIQNKKIIVTEADYYTYNDGESGYNIECYILSK